MRPAKTGLVFGTALMLGALASTGAGHGSYMPLAIAAAPVSLIPVAGFFAAPIWWGAIGVLAALRWPLAVLGLLVAHTITVFAILWLGSPMEPGRELWSSFWYTMRHIPFILGPTLVIYMVGLAVAWEWTFRELSSWIDA